MSNGPQLAGLASWGCPLQAAGCPTHSGRAIRPWSAQWGARGGPAGVPYAAAFRTPGEPLLNRINQELEGSEIRVLGLERATQGFCAHTMCSSREYEYLLPTYVLRPPRPAAAEFRVQSL